MGLLCLYPVFLYIGTNVSTQVRKLPGPEWGIPIRVLAPELVRGCSYFGIGLNLFFFSVWGVGSYEIQTFSPFTPYIVLRCHHPRHRSTQLPLLFILH